jgi:hypothetical protein
MDLRRDLGDVTRSDPEKLPDTGGRIRLRMGAKQLDPGPEGRSALRFPAAADVSHHSLLPGQARELLGGAGLSDSRLSAQQRQPSTPLRRGAKGAVEVAEQLPAPDEGRGREVGPMLDLGDLGDEAQASATNGLENGLRAAVIPQHPPGLIEGLIERLIGHDGVRPYVREQLLPGNDAPPAADQVEEKIHLLVLDRHRLAIPAKLTKMVIELESAEPNDHRPPSIR